ncbi:MAG: DUF192 domain-containing protein [Nanoarchaeota archaeon]|nr:DUF192 domain-containing protein [Nanoarchaeota archaeon]
MKKPSIYLGSLFFVVVILSCTFSDHQKICFKDGSCIDAEVMDTAEKRTKGLMGRESLAEEKGMLFVFDKSGEYAFWMKDTNFAIDMIWVDESDRIVHIERNAQPCKADPCKVYAPNADSLFVIEVVSGYSIEHGINKGDTVLFS